MHPDNKDAMLPPHHEGSHASPFPSTRALTRRFEGDFSLYSRGTVAQSTEDNGNIHRHKGRFLSSRRATMSPRMRRGYTELFLPPPVGKKAFRRRVETETIYHLKLSAQSHAQQCQAQAKMKSNDTIRRRQVRTQPAAKDKPQHRGNRHRGEGRRPPRQSPSASERATHQIQGPWRGQGPGAGARHRGA